MDKDLRNKIIDIYESSAIDKSLYSSSGLNEQSIPVFVGEWLIDRQLKGGDWTEDVKQQVIGFIHKFMPSKDEIEDLKQKLRNGDSVSVLEYISPKVNLNRDQTYMESGSLGNQKVFVEEFLLNKFPRLLKGGMWGLAIYGYRRNNDGGEVWLNDFKPLQASAIDFEEYVENRSQFSLEEWQQLLINSLGYSAEDKGYGTRQRRQALLTRLLPFVQRRVNLFELAPKGTGKSFLFGQFSRYSRLIEGGAVTPAVLFYNENTKVPGLFTQFDVVVFDEAQTLSFSNPGETVAKLKGYLEQGKYSKGKYTVAADAGAVFIANVQIDAKGLPTNRNNLFGELPEILQESALLDRIHGILPGWNLPRMTTGALSDGVGFKADFLGEIFHFMRSRLEFDRFVEERSYMIGSKDFRDVRAIMRMAAGYLKLLFPNLTDVTDDIYIENCLKPAIELRQRLREQLYYIDPEFKNYEITIEHTKSGIVIPMEEPESEQADLKDFK
ncbi:BREX system Lon protease-like protein BrxL [Mucilaginibacter myungsuensis]|uniref:BREX system Lon protease-like protein BrxL n=1 Tax=Mucilaginibacter myungsuensis TaxID=649104 RepID=A0A929KZW3_9SPHI|nr:BREX system Lon protease-like protein BrxL [Mucilaginibacter myungsuensis]MBE9663023.1 BREX system Lon protease-like protein BrxL [Mucilaginibacter myungsuensis]MDN3598653.1 BREX system Lon protease-like protein BrxL [Mucilaginibacter myungsuensis]